MTLESSNKGNNGNQSIVSTELSELNLKYIFHLLFEHKWLFVIFGIVFIFLGWVYTWRIVPVYQTTALIQVMNNSSNVQSQLQLSINNGLSTAQNSSLAAIEKVLIKSRFILKPAIKKAGLDVQVYPHYFPFIGTKMALSHQSDSKLSKPFLGLSHYAWGGERVKIGRFKLLGRNRRGSFILEAKKQGHYELYTASGKLILRGRVGYRELSGKRSVYPGLSIEITQLKANPGARFTIVKANIYSLVNSLSSRLDIEDAGMLMRAGMTGILQLTLRGTNPFILPKMLNTIISYDAKQNEKQKILEIEKSLSFLNKQLPILKNEVDEAAGKLNTYFTNHMNDGLLGADLNTQDDTAGGGGGNSILLNQIISLESNYENLKLQKTMLLQMYTHKHPYIIEINDKLKLMEHELNQLRNQMRTLPKAQQMALDLKRDVKVRSQLYMLVITKIQELELSKAGMVGNVRILGEATPVNLLSNDKTVVIIGSFLLGLLLAFFIVFLKSIFDTSIQDPEVVEHRVGISAFALVPYSKEQEKVAKTIKRQQGGQEGQGVELLLAKNKPKDIAIESLRSLRTNLQFTMLEAEGNIISILGAGASIGKSFISSNLSYLFADSEKKVLLIDADMRKGKLHRYFGLKQSPGLAEYLAGKVTLDKVRHSIIPDRLDYIACGEYPTNPAELLFNNRFTQLLTNSSKEYDLVIIDTPPILSVTDALIIIQHASINLMAVCLYRDNIRDVERSVKLVNKHSHIDGLVFNSIDKVKGVYGYGYSYKSYYYADNDK